MQIAGQFSDFPRKMKGAGHVTGFGMRGRWGLNLGIYGSSTTVVLSVALELVLELVLDGARWC